MPHPEFIEGRQAQGEQSLIHQSNTTHAEFIEAFFLLSVLLWIQGGVLAQNILRQAQDEIGVGSR